MEQKQLSFTGSDLFLIIKQTYNDVHADHLKQIKRLLRNTTGERFVTAQKTDFIYLAFDRKSKVVGYAMTSSYSPEKHFKNEKITKSDMSNNNGNDAPNNGMYLYNFITDTALIKEKRCGRYLLKYIENDLSRIGYTLINLDVEHVNLHAFKFFVHNKYKVVGKYEKLDLRNMNLHEVDKTIRNLSLKDEISDIKQRRGIKEGLQNDSLDDNKPHKKITYISMTKLLEDSTD